MSCIILRNYYNKKRIKIDICSNCDAINSKKSCIGYQNQTQALLKIEEKLSNFIINREVKYYD